MKTLQQKIKALVLCVILDLTIFYFNTLTYAVLSFLVELNCLMQCSWKWGK